MNFPSSSSFLHNKYSTQTNKEIRFRDGLCFAVQYFFFFLLFSVIDCEDVNFASSKIIVLRIFHPVVAVFFLMKLLHELSERWDTEDLPFAKCN